MSCHHKICSVDKTVKVKQGYLHRLLQVSLPGALDQLLWAGGGRAGVRGGGLPAQQPEHRRHRQHGLRLRDGMQQHQVMLAPELFIYSLVVLIH